MGTLLDQGQRPLHYRGRGRRRYLQSLTFLAHAGRVDLARALDLRTGSDFSIPPKGMSAVDFLKSEARGNYAANAGGNQERLSSRQPRRTRAGATLAALSADRARREALRPAVEDASPREVGLSSRFFKQSLPVIARFFLAGTSGGDIKVSPAPAMDSIRVDLVDLDRGIRNYRSAHVCPMKLTKLPVSAGSRAGLI